MPKLTFSTPWQKHQAKWLDCKLCDYCKTRKRVCLARGSLPCDILFVGEAPGPSEDVLGLPFTGPAGHLLDKAIADAQESMSMEGNNSLRLCFTNLVACIPINPLEGEKFAEPGKKEIEACEPRLDELVSLARPRAMVLVGKLAQKYITGQAQFSACSELWLGDNDYLKFIEITHPAAILRADISQQGLAYQRIVVQLRDLFQEMSE